MIIRPSRHKPLVGDLFVLNLVGKRWIAGRVIRTDARAFGENNRLLYFYRLDFAKPEEITTPLRPDLMIAPTITNDLGWRRGYYAHLRNVPLQAEELLPRHVFENVVHPADDPRHFQDEYGRPTSSPEPGLPSGWAALWNYAAIDAWLSEAIGIPKRDVGAAPPGVFEQRSRPSNSRDCELTLHIPPAPELDLDEFEEELIEAIEESSAGKWEGHGTDLRTGFFDIRFQGPKLEPLVNALRPVLKRIGRQLPNGWYLTCYEGSKTERRVGL